MIQRVLLSLLFILSLSFLSAQEISNDSLVAGAVRADSIFWDGYNHCAINQMMQFVPDDLEFYHDKGGITLGDSAFEASIKFRLCSDQGKFRLRRAIVQGTGHAYPMMKDGKVYGVVMAGKHLFYLTSAGEKEHVDGLAQYADLWLIRDGAWKLARVFSYDHGPAPYVNERKPIAIERKMLQEFAGSYKGPANSVTMHLDGDRLMTSLGHQPVELFAEKQHLFYVDSRDLTFEFVREKNVVKKMIVRENGKIVEELEKIK